MGNNENLSAAKKALNDEFYTRLEDIEKELSHYAGHFTGKSVYLNCDDFAQSMFWEYFKDHFEELGVKKLTATGYKENGHGIFAEYEGNTVTSGKLEGDGDFSSEECLAILDSCDIVVTNPPFSLFLKFFSTIVEHGKDFIVIGNSNSVFCKDVFPRFQDGSVSVGINKPKWFNVPDAYEAKNVDFADGQRIAKFGNICWYTTLPPERKNPPLELTAEYAGREDEYPEYDNYDAIEVGTLKDIPKDYFGIMGVPISMIEKHCPEQFEIIWQASGNTRACCPKDILQRLGYERNDMDRGGAAMLNGKLMYSRVFVQRVVDKLD